MAKKGPRVIDPGVFIPPCGAERTSLRVSRDTEQLLNDVRWHLALRLRQTGYAVDLSRSSRLTDDDVLRHVLAVYCETFRIPVPCYDPPKEGA